MHVCAIFQGPCACAYIHGELPYPSSLLADPQTWTLRSEVTTIILEQRQYKERMGLYPVLCELLQVDGDEAEHP
jgi:hypothetical protein